MEYTYNKYLGYIYPNDQWHHLYIKPEFFEHINTKYKIFKQYNKSNVAEIGVRFGYALYAFCHVNENLNYDGYDLINGGHGGQLNIDTFPYIKERIIKEFPNVNLNLYHINTQTINVLNKKYDYIHIDGDHSYNGCYHDIETSYNSCNPQGILHLDDYEHISVPEVKLAINDWVIKNEDKIKKHYYVESFRGEYIIELK